MNPVLPFFMRPVALRSPKALAWTSALVASLSAGAQDAQWLQEPAVQVQGGQPLVLRAGLQWQHDNNVLRSTSGPTHDHLAVYTAGLRFDQSYSRQRLELDAQVDAYRYQRISALDFDALNYRGAWHWGLGPQWSGRLASERRQWVDRLGESSADSGLIRRTEAAWLLELQYRLTASWQALGGVFDRRQKNTDPLGLEPDSQVQGGQIGVRYDWPSDSSLTYLFRQGHGRYAGLAQPQTPGDFREREHGFDWNWTGAGRWRLQGQLAHLQRDQELGSDRDFSGWTARVGGQWDLTGKTLMGLGAVRELGAYQTAQASYFEGYRVYLAPQWQATAKTLLRLRWEEGQRSYRGAPTGAEPSGRRDRLQSLGIEGQWQATRTLQVALSALRDQRRSNQPQVRYNAQVFAVALRGAF